MQPVTDAPAWKVATAFAAVYLIWGSTYLAIRFAVETLPPFLMAATRFLVAGGMLYGWTRLRGDVRPTREHWRTALILGFLLLLLGNGGVVWAEQWVASGLAALLIATEPLFIVLLSWRGRRRHAPSGTVMAGIACGFVGVAFLVGRGAGGVGTVDPLGATILVLASFFWAIGSLYSPRAPKPSSQTVFAATQMLAGGALLLAAGIATGEPARLDLSRVSMLSMVSLAYLTLFGSLIAFLAYSWLLQVTAPVRVATYAFVNPVVAVLAGWAFAGEQVGWRTFVAAGLILGSVGLILWRRRHRGLAVPGTEEASEEGVVCLPESAETTASRLPGRADSTTT